MDEEEHTSVVLHADLDCFYVAVLFMSSVLSRTSPKTLMIGNCHYHNYQLIQINHRLQDGVREMKRSPLNIVFNHK